MKVIRKAGLAGVLALAALAVVSVASATATSSTLCKNSTNSPYCKTEDRLAKGTAIAASTTSLEIKTTTPVVSVSCAESGLAGETTTQSGEPMSLSVASFSIGKCTTLGKACTITADSTPPYSSSLAWTDHANGSLTIGSEVGGKPAWRVQCGEIIDCHYELNSSLQLKGGASGNIVASGASLKNLKGTICPKSAVMNATYKVTSPSGLYVARAQSPPAETTGLCKANDYYCEPADLYPSGTSLEGTSTNIKFDMPAGYALGDMTCDSGSASTKTLAAYGQPLPLEHAFFGFGHCGFSAPENCQVTQLTGYSGSVSRSSGYGLWKGSGWQLKMNCIGYFECTFTVANESTIWIIPGGPGALSLAVPMNVSGGVLCPKSVSFLASYPLTSPSGSLFITDVTR